MSDVPQFLEEKEAFDAAYDELLQAGCIGAGENLLWIQAAQYGTVAEDGCTGVTDCSSVTQLTSIDCL